MSNQACPCSAAAAHVDPYDSPAQHPSARNLPRQTETDFPVSYRIRSHPLTTRTDSPGHVPPATLPRLPRSRQPNSTTQARPARTPIRPALLNRQPTTRRARFSTGQSPAFRVDMPASPRSNQPRPQLAPTAHGPPASDPLTLQPFRRSSPFRLKTFPSIRQALANPLDNRALPRPGHYGSVRL